VAVGPGGLGAFGRGDAAEDDALEVSDPGRCIPRGRCPRVVHARPASAAATSGLMTTVVAPRRICNWFIWRLC
jgi:hypothetical protein